MYLRSSSDPHSSSSHSSSHHAPADSHSTHASHQKHGAYAYADHGEDLHSGGSSGVHAPSNESLAYCPPVVHNYLIDENVQHYWCQPPRYSTNGSTLLSGEYNEGT